MLLDEFFESWELSTKKTIWSKRGDKVTKHDVEHIPVTDITSRKYVQIKKEDKDGDE